MTTEHERVWQEWQTHWNPDGDYPPERNDLPACLWNLWETGPGMDPGFYAYAVADAWSLAEVPMHALPRESWIALWQVGGYVVDGASAPRRRRRRTMSLYRVALLSELDSGALGLSWTPDLAFAETFRTIRHGRYPRLARHVILTATVEPRMILGELTAAYGRGEPEVVADIPTSEVTLVRN